MSPEGGRSKESGSSPGAASIPAALSAPESSAELVLSVLTWMVSGGSALFARQRASAPSYPRRRTKSSAIQRESV